MIKEAHTRQQLLSKMKNHIANASQANKDARNMSRFYSDDSKRQARRLARKADMHTKAVMVASKILQRSDPVYESMDGFQSGMAALDNVIIQKKEQHKRIINHMQNRSATELNMLNKRKRALLAARKVQK